MASEVQSEMSSSSSRVERLVPPVRVWVAVAVFALFGAFSWWQADALAETFAFAGPAIARIFIAISVVATVFTLLGWLVFRSTYPASTKASVVLVVIALPIVFKVEHSGDLFSSNIRLRWYAPDRNLKPPVIDEFDKVATSNSPKRIDPMGFTQFLGSERNGSVSGVTLQEEWGPREIWRQQIGAGWSGCIAVHGMLITQEQRGDLEMVTAYTIGTGRPLWFHSEETRHEEELGGIGPRATPTYHDGRIYAVGATGILVCLDSVSGELIWKRNVVEDVGSDRATDASAILWGRAGSPLIVDDKVVVPAGGKSGSTVSLIAYSQADGSEVWRGGDHQISYSSPVLMTLDGRRQIVTVDESAVSGHDPETGTRLWTHFRKGSSGGDANTSQPMAVGEDRVLVSKGYGLGAELLEIDASEDGSCSVKSVWVNERVLRTKLTSAVVIGDYAYGLSDGILECVSLEDGKRVWRNGRMGHGQLLAVDRDLIVLSERGELYRVPAMIDGYQASEPLTALDGICWNTLCLYGNKLVLRNSREIVCFEVDVRIAAPNPEGGPPRIGLIQALIPELEESQNTESTETTEGAGDSGEKRDETGEQQDNG